MGTSRHRDSEISARTHITAAPHAAVREVSYLGSLYRHGEGRSQATRAIVCIALFFAREEKRGEKAFPLNISYVYNKGMGFEYDRNKSDANKEKHGIDFEEAQALWLDENRVVVRTRFVSEHRYLVIGRIGGVYWTAVITSRDNAVRIISVRRSRDTEKDIYDG
jgi:uncharacterized DUF497 family protein